MYVKQSNAAVLQQHPQHPGLTARKAAVAATAVLELKCTVQLIKQQPLLLRYAAAAGTGSSAAGASSSKWVRSLEAPWSLTFDLRERETDWTDANKVRTPPGCGSTPTHSGRQCNLPGEKCLYQWPCR
jgi:hypothetical protein